MTRPPVASTPFRKPRRLTLSITAWKGVMSGSCGGRLDGGGDALIAAAATDIAAHRIVYFGFRRVLVCREERRGLHDLPGLAIPALRDIQCAPSLLHRMVTVAVGPLDRYHHTSIDITDSGGAGTGGLAVDMHRAGAAQGHAAAIFCSGETDLVPQVPEQWHRWVAVKRLLLAIDA